MMTTLKYLSKTILLPLILILSPALLRMANADPPSAGGSPSGEIYAVTGVARDDALNIRSRPEASAARVGVIPPDGTGIRLLGPTAKVGSSTWREIEYQGMRGWVNARFLAAPPARPDTDGLEMDLQCLGTEPFWNMHIQGSRMELDRMGNKTSFTVSAPVASANHANIWSMTFANPATGAHGVAFVERTGHCSDDMSDHRYEYTLRTRFGDDAVLSGCCNRKP
ncbi:MAG: hypothetical protein KDI50_01525 [Candidatus Competibacteraceae bacterium]|nr:hypothetical protein [Candidatus Competibacteraceae bacterium]